ncbi:MAG: type II toxin-antitoxin system RelE/ParE family toxin [Candidatus Aenigmarchaeota archaeon]|nr:type II toxin-antitoxin system RelE/ParE family toxin [Candidatus Aenigmarchaeota archaeon]
MFQVKLHKNVSKFLEKLDTKNKAACRKAIDELSNNPFVRRPGCDIKKLGGKEDVYKLRVGSIRLNYIVIKDTLIIYINDAFYRSRGYR